MKRDMELIRRILLQIEEEHYHAPDPFELPGEDPAVVGGHLVLMREAGLIDAKILQTHEHPIVVVLGLKWAGHDFLENVRNDVVWRKTLTFVTEKGGAVTLSVLKAIAAQFASSHLGLPG